MYLHKESKTFSLKNIAIFSGLFLVITVVLGYGFFDFSTDSFKDQLTATHFNEESILIQPQEGDFYKINKNTNKKWFAKAGLFITVTDKKIIFTDTKDKSDKMNDYYNLWIPKNKHYQLVLADGSEIKLNENTHIRFNNNRLSQKAQVFLLKGEAFFNVAHNQNEIFKIKSDKMSVEVYGTSFNLKNDKKEACSTVTLVDGSVKVSNSLQASTFIKPGEQATLYNNKETIKVVQAKMSEELIWTSNQFYFTDETLESILNKLAIWHKKEFVFKEESLKKIRFTGSLKKEEGIQGFLKELEYTERIHYSIENNRILLYKTNQNK